MQNLPALKVQGNRVMAGEKAIRLRGLDWGWWHLSGTRYTQANIKSEADRGVNVIRLSFSYNELMDEGQKPTWNEQGFRDLEEVVQWGRHHGVYVILDMHVAPGGQNGHHYVAGGKNQLWTDATAQERYLALWQEIARRYHDRPEVAAYELLNEPNTMKKTPEMLRQMYERTIRNIREVDAQKMIVVGGDWGSLAGDLVEGIKLDDSNILYTFHWYVGAGGNEDWVGKEKLEQGSNTQEWKQLEKVFTVPAGADHLSVLLGATGYPGTAWFDEVEVTDLASRVLENSDFSRQTQGYQPEGLPEAMAYDAAVGHTRPGSLAIHGKNQWAGWIGKRVEVEAGKQYRVRVWVKVDNPARSACLAVSYFRIKAQLDTEVFTQKIAPAVEFACKYQVPLWVGEFGCDAANPDLQEQWVRACIALFEKHDIAWTYWNYRETTEPNSMALQAQRPDGGDFPVNERLLEALREGWMRNRDR